MLIKIEDYTEVLNEETESDIIAYIDGQIHLGIWTSQTKIEAFENGKCIDSGTVSDFFNIH